MTAEERREMNSLCIQIQEEKDHDRFIRLMSDLSHLVELKERRFGHGPSKREWQKARPRKTLSGIVRKILEPALPKESEKVEISILGADELFREIRIENAFTDFDGQTVALKHGADVDVIIEATNRDSITK